MLSSSILFLNKATQLNYAVFLTIIFNLKYNFWNNMERHTGAPYYSISYSII